MKEWHMMDLALPFIQDLLATCLQWGSAEDLGADCRAEIAPDVVPMR